MSVTMSAETKALIAKAHQNKGEVCPLMRTPRCKGTCGVKTKISLVQAVNSGTIVKLSVAPTPVIQAPLMKLQA